MKSKYSYNKNSNKTIWVDLDNSPHIPFFAPIINSLESEGYNVVISARNYSQTVSLADLYNLDYKPIGKHYGKNKFIKIIGLFFRTLQLLPFAIKSKPTLAISHGSRSQMMAAYFLRIPIAMFLDYEYIQTVPFAKPKIIFLPNIISIDKIKNLGDSISTYPGIKEDVYVPKFQPNESINNVVKIDKNLINVVLRPPAYEAHYHNPESEKLFDEIIKTLTQNKSVQTYILPRDKKQKQQILTQFKEHFQSSALVIPNEVVDGLNLMWHSDLVISGGGTMNREAAALGLPVYSIFKGRIGDIDKYLSDNGRLILIETMNDIKDKIILRKRKNTSKLNNVNSLALQSIINKLESAIKEISEPAIPTNYNDKNETKPTISSRTKTN